MNYKTLGDRVVEDYFKRMDESETNNLLEDIITDAARKHELNNQEIARVCQYANTKIFLRLHKATQDKTSEFNVADPGQIIERISEKTNVPDLDFDDSYYIIESNDEKEDTDTEKVVNIPELFGLAQKLRDERDGLEIKLMEEKPALLKLLATKLQRRPKIITYVAKTAGAPNELLKEASVRAGLDEVPDVTGIDILVNNDSDDEFLQKVAAYGKMKARFEEVTEKLEKAASIVGFAARHPLRSYGAFGEVDQAKGKPRNYRKKLMGLDDIKISDLKQSYQNQSTKGGKF